MDQKAMFAVPKAVRWITVHPSGERRPRPRRANGLSRRPSNWHAVPRFQANPHLSRVFQMTNLPTDHQNLELTLEELLGWLEFACWTTLGLAPFLYWINGPAVSTDQFVVRTALVILAACGAIGLRLFAWLRK
jgi:hypothetical protein